MIIVQNITHNSFQQPWIFIIFPMDPPSIPQEKKYLAFQKQNTKTQIDLLLTPLTDFASVSLNFQVPSLYKRVKTELNNTRAIFSPPQFLNTHYHVSWRIKNRATSLATRSSKSERMYSILLKDLSSIVGIVGRVGKKPLNFIVTGWWGWGGGSSCCGMSVMVWMIHILKSFPQLRFYKRVFMRRQPFFEMF